MDLVVGHSDRHVGVKRYYCFAGLLLAKLIATASGAAFGAIPKRSVTGTTVSSSVEPAVSIRLPDDVLYAGTDSFTISKPNTANACQLFAFAKASPDGSLSKLYWVHFEKILPRFPKASMEYEGPYHQKIDDLEFVVDTEVSDGTHPPTVGSDTEHFYNLLARHGYRRAPMIFVRFVHLLDSTKRKELMIIVGEALPPGMTAESLKPGGASYGQRPAIDQEFVSRAAQSITIRARKSND